MKDKYSIHVQLQCATCGAEQFDFNDDKSFVKCRTCNREYQNGYDELVEFNQERIAMEKEQITQEITNDLKKDITKSIKDAFRGNKFIKIK